MEYQEHMYNSCLIRYTVTVNDTVTENVQEIIFACDFKGS